MFPGYTINESLGEVSHWHLYRCKRSRDQLPVLIKTTRKQSATPFLVEQLESEFNTLRNINIPGVLKAYDLIISPDNAALVLQDPGGLLLDKILDFKRLSISEFLEIATKITAIIVQLHSRGIVHARLQPGVILLSKDGQNTWILGFDNTLKLHSDTPDILTLEEDNLAYIAPEQTGRMDTNIDYRTDLYSLGAIMYEMLTGKPPFDTRVPMELVHCHLARNPKPPLETDPEIPRPLSDIVMHLLMKKAQDRYKSARGVLTDLNECDQQYRTNAQIGAVNIAQHDCPELLEIPDRLYGRSRELEKLLSAFASVCKDGTRLVLVSGKSGVGKTSLIKHIRIPVVQGNGYFVSGKYDQLERSNPYSAILEAFVELLELILTETDTEIALYKQRILDALGNNARVIIEVIPQLKLIIGEQPSIPELKPVEAQNRFNFYFQKFIAVFARPEQPIVLFFDDLQWASMASIRLFQSLVNATGINGLLMIGAYRDNEVSVGHPLNIAIQELQESSLSLEEIKLTALNINSVSQIIQDALGCSDRDAQILTRCVYDKTGGNPFFTRSFLLSLYEEGLLHINKNASWSWDINTITSRYAIGNVIELLLNKIERLPVKDRDVINLAACMGNRFNLKLLAMVYGKSPDKTRQYLQNALNSGLIQYQDDRAFSFYHDRIQEAAYNMIPEEQRERIHYQIGSLLLASNENKDLEEHLFEIINHLNISKVLIRDTAQKKRLAQFNLQAGLKAMTTTAYDSAYGYFNQGIMLLASETWEQDHELAFSLYCKRAECAYLCGLHKEAEADFELLMKQARNRSEQGLIYNIRIIQYESMSRFSAAKAFALQGLDLFNIQFPETEDEVLSQLDKEIKFIQQQVAGKPIIELENLPVLKDADVKICMKLLMHMWAPTYISGDINLTMLIASRMVLLSLQYGNSEESAYGYVTHAISIAARDSNYRSAYQFGQLALLINHKFKDLTARAKINHMFSCYICLWQEHIKECFKYSLIAYETGIETGDFIYGSYGGFHESWHALFSGMNLERYNAVYNAKLEFLSGFKYQSISDAHQLMLQWGRCLQGETDTPLSLDGNGFDEQAYENNYRKIPFFIAFYYVAKLNICLLNRDYLAARQFAELADTVIHGVRGMIWEALLCFNYALTLTALYESLDNEQQAVTMEKLDLLRTRMHQWADNSPQNFAQQYYLIHAEISRIQNHYDEAITYYDLAIKASHKHEFINIQALANELCGYFWLQRGQERVAGSFISEAINLYLRWGAHVRVKQLEKNYMHLPGCAVQPETAIHSQLSESLDIATILKVSQAISEEMVLHRLVDQLMQIVLENAGAERGLLLCPDGHEWHVEAQGVVAGEAISVTIPDDNEQSAGWSKSIVNYVRRTHECLLTDDARLDNRFLADVYVRGNNVKSVLCVPIVHQRELTAILYLENNLTSNAFTGERVFLMQTLATQTAIALKNARLYSDIMTEIDERREAESTLRLIASGTAAVTGEDFFKSLVQNLAASLNVKSVFVAECIKPGNLRVRTLAFMDKGRFTDNIEYDVAQTPCEGVVQGNVCYYPENLEKLYPIEKGYESYLGAPAMDLTGRVLGHLAILDTTDMRHLPHAESILRIFATRVGVELHRKRTQEALQASEEKYRLLVDNQTDLVVKLDRAGGFLFVSPSCCEMFSCSENELLGSVFHKLIYSNDRERVEAEWNNLFSSPWMAQFEHRAITATGERWMAWALKGLRDDSGAIAEIVGVGRDVTDRRLAEEQSRQHLHTLAHAGRLHSMGEMASTLAHELNQPLTAILSFSQACQRDIIKQDYDKEQLAFALDRIAVNARRAGDIISHMRGFVRKEAPRTEPVNINCLIRETLELVSGELRKKEIAQVLDLQEPLPETPIDAVQIQQVILNLIRNSMEAMEQAAVGKHSITVKTRLNQSGAIELAVSDTGPGLDKEIAENVFTAFVSTKKEGMGVGLSICQSIVEAHGSRLIARSCPEGGAVFSFVLLCDGQGGDL